ncbi:AT-rich interactive domain-containing protein 5A isoform X2 [Esox lucius]|nr:AT-rich interactive domain-containing protein 5A isoform X2 [Esox lucius]XP_010874685.2 AT-rich interactive domain-containing protein 5A isoform X2 [Esox lucius]XP_034152179.1 AT-rich interactive domain-containing protein 5A isoform X2 [Esox lucius]
MEISDSASECEDRPSSSPMEERSFVARLHCYMKDRGTPIERIPHLGFKQINLWKIYKAVEKLGGYDSVTARRLWKNVYDELGGSPGSTSAATCTRRHYERLVLPFERQLRGEEDKPLPPSKPRKQYKRSSESKGSKSEGKRKRPHLEKETDSEGQVHSTSSSPWTALSERLHPDCPPPISENTAGDDLSAFSSSQPAQGPTSSSWRGVHVQSSTATDIISPLEKKKRMAQASLSQSQESSLSQSKNSKSPKQEDCKGRPSVIQCSDSPGLLHPRRTRATSEGSPQPPSSSSSRSPSPYSISSEDCQALTEDRPPVPKPEIPLNFSINPMPSRSGVHKPQSCSPDVKEYVNLAGGHRDFSQVSPLQSDTVYIKGQSKNSLWSPVCNASRRQTHQIPPPMSCKVRSCLIPSTSSFTKVYPKSMEPLRPIPFQPGYTLHQNPNRSMLHDDSLIYTKKLHMVPEHYQTEKKEKSRTVLPKPLPTQPPVFHSNASIPVSYLVPACDKTRGDSGQKTPVNPVFLPTYIRLPQSQTNPMFRHASMGPTLASPYEPTLISYPYRIPMWNSGYSNTGVYYPYSRL